MAEISYKIRKIEDRKQEPLRRVDLNGQIICYGCKKPRYYIRNCSEREKREKNNYKREENSNRIRKKGVNMMKGGRTVNVMDSKRKKMKETDGMLSFNVLS
jgi:hypothetical protein